jgi:hypothetical protein
VKWRNGRNALHQMARYGTSVRVVSEAPNKERLQKLGRGRTEVVLHDPDSKGLRIHSGRAAIGRPTSSMRRPS